jgi:hypothetical protein
MFIQNSTSITKAGWCLSKDVIIVQVVVWIAGSLAVVEVVGHIIIALFQIVFVGDFVLVVVGIRALIIIAWNTFVLLFNVVLLLNVTEFNAINELKLTRSWSILSAFFSKLAMRSSTVVSFSLRILVFLPAAWPFQSSSAGKREKSKCEK